MFLVPVSNFLWLISNSLKFLKNSQDSIASMVVVKKIQYMYTSTSLEPVVDELATSYLVLATFICDLLYLQKLQVQELINCLNIRDLTCEVGATVYTLVRFELEIRPFCGMINMKRQFKFFMRVDPFSHEGGPAQRMVLKAISNIGLAAS